MTSPDFLAWCASHSLTHSSITPVSTPTSGLGIQTLTPISGPVLTKTTSTGSSTAGTRQRRGFTAGQTLVAVPPSILLNRDTVSTFCPSLPPASSTAHLSTHALLATAIHLETPNASNPWAPWLATFPTLADFKTSLPLLWPDSQQALLPTSAQKLLKAQQRNYDLDIAAVQSLGLIGDDDEEHWRWAWCIVNTRTLFYTPKNTDGKIPKRDMMSLCPFVDIFNHASQAHCRVEYHDDRGYVVTADSDIPTEGTELYVSYGCHSNDFLLVEYGFILPAQENRWDEFCVDSQVLATLEHAFGKGILRLLEQEGFCGNYVFDGNAFCYRTQAAVRLLVFEGDEEMWRTFLAGEEGGVEEEREVAAALRTVLSKVREESEQKAAGCAKVEGRAGELLRERWSQVAVMAERVEANLA